MRRISILILFVVCFNDLLATEYYVGGTGASDNNPGTAAQPFATIQKAASVAVAGDVVNIRSGTYRETVVPTNSGTAGNPVVYQAESGANVIISGCNPVISAWTVHSGNIYKTTVTLPVNGYANTITSNTTILANQVFKDNGMMFEARWPDVSSMEDLFDRNKLRPLSSMVSFNPSSLTDNGLPQIPGGLNGGKIWINGWFISQTKTITSHSGSTINYEESINDAKFRKYYYVTGKLGLLSIEKEWHYENNTLYFWQPGGGAPTGVEYKARNYGFDLSNKSGITIKDVQLFGCTINGNTNSNNNVVDGIKAKYINHTVTQGSHYFNPPQTGIKLIGSNNIIRNSEIQYASSQGIWLGNNSTATNNLITDISYEGNYGCAIKPWSETGGQTITYNTITKTGRSGIDIGNGGSHRNMVIGYNDISRFGMLNVDLGGIYGAIHTDLTGTRIHHNWVHDTGVANPTVVDGIQTGIYLDQAAGPITMDHNVLWNNGVADFYNEISNPHRNSGGSKLFNNTFATTTRHSYVTYVTTPPDVQKNNIYRKDIVINWGAGLGDVTNALLQGVDPQFVGTGAGGLAYRIRSTSPAVNRGVAIPGITDGSVGVPDIGAYEYGGNDWVPGYKPTTSATINTPPLVNVTSPSNNATFTEGTSINITANASDANGTVTRVEFFYGTIKIGEDLTSPYSFTWTNPPVGTHAITARATDNQNSMTTSGVVNVTVGANTPPTASITAPANDAQIQEGTAINITATAADANGTVTKVEFFNGTTKLGEDLTNPYSFSWTNAPAGTHSLTVKATDNNNSVTTSSVVRITVTANTFPVTAITAPANNAQFVSGATITITANATDNNGAVTKVEFFNGNTKLGEDVTTPYSFVWNNAPVGTHTLTSRATDNQGNVTTSTAVTINVSTNPPPIVSITSPSNNGQYISGSSITITATASDANGSVTKVEFFNGTTKLGEDLTSPYSFVWANAPVGSHSITARATDNQNSTTTSSVLSITVNENTPPRVSITGPSNNAQFTAGSTITITATATVTSGTVSKVEFFNGTTKLGEDLTSPYSFTWANATAGNHTITAKATDTQAAVGASTPVVVQVAIANTPPVVQITSPSNNTNFFVGSPITIAANATDANGTITKVEFFRGTTKIGEDLTRPFSFVWNNAAVGNYSLVAKATDNQGAVTTSSAVAITVAANAPPTVQLTSPLRNASFQVGSPITINATAADANGSVTKVEFFRGTTKIGEDLTSPYSIIWNNAAVGNYSLVAKATDNQGAVTTSAAVAISVVANTPPTVNITAPSNNATFDAGSSITITANASDANGSVSKVEFYRGTTKIGEDLTSPYSVVWNNAPLGNHTITAKAIDNQNAATTSQAITIAVISTVNPNADAGGDVSLTLPENSTTLSAQALPDGPSLKYSWKQISGPGTIVIANPASQAIDLKGLIEGVYVFELTVTDINGLSSKDLVQITVLGQSDTIDLQELQSSIPRFFSPNDDGIGDVWEWSQIERFENSVLTVFSRSGQKIYETVSYDNTWNGKMGERTLQAGDYYYVVKLGNDKFLRGALQIIR